VILGLFEDREDLPAQNFHGLLEATLILKGTDDPIVDQRVFPFLAEPFEDGQLAFPERDGLLQEAVSLLELAEEAKRHCRLVFILRLGIELELLLGRSETAFEPTLPQGHGGEGPQEIRPLFGLGQVF